MATASAPWIGTLRERPLHASLKRWYAEPGDRAEVAVDGYVIDLVRGDLLIEVQTRGLRRRATSSRPCSPSGIASGSSPDRRRHLDRQGRRRRHRARPPPLTAAWRPSDVFAELVSLAPLLSIRASRSTSS